MNTIAAATISQRKLEASSKSQEPHSEMKARTPHPNPITAAAEEIAIRSAERALRNLHRELAEQLGVAVVPPTKKEQNGSES